jgi:hypothetical protein
VSKHNLDDYFVLKDPTLVVESMLTDEEEQSFLDNAHIRNPHLRGANVADILDMMHQADAHLEVTEPVMHRFLEYTGGEPSRLSQLFELCLFAAIYIRRDPTEGAVPLAHEIYGRLPAQALEEPVPPS